MRLGKHRTCESHASLVNICLKLIYKHFTLDGVRMFVLSAGGVITLWFGFESVGWNVIYTNLKFIHLPWPMYHHGYVSAGFIYVIGFYNFILLKNNIIIFF